MRAFRLSFKSVALLATTVLYMPMILKAQQPVAVTVDNFVRAESDGYFAGEVKQSGGLGKFHHGRPIASVDHQPVIRYNRDVLRPGRSSI